MELEIKTDKKNEMAFIIHGEGHTFAQLLVAELLKNENVEIAQYNIPHPLVGQPVFYLKTKNQSARDVLKKTVKAVKKDIKELS
jgi:DNA-directed RNA polymerase subunit L